MSKNVLVTGGLGFIGSHTVVALYEAGFNPVIVDNLSNSKIGILDHIQHISKQSPKFYEEDVLHNLDMEYILKKESISAVIHFAAYKSVSESLNDQLSYYEKQLMEVQQTSLKLTYVALKLT